MLIRMTSIALALAAVGLGPSEKGALAGTDDSERAFVGADGGFAQVAQPANRPPRVNRRIPDKTVQEGAAFSFRIPARTFRDLDGDRLTISVQEQSDWLSFDPGTQRVAGMPVAFDQPALVRVRATDVLGARATTSFRVNIRPAALADDAPPNQSTPSPNSDGSTESTRPSISADGRFVAHVYNDPATIQQSIVIRNFISGSFSDGSFTVAGPQSYPDFSGEPRRFGSPAISADGRLVAFVGQTAPEASIQGVEARVVGIANSDPLELETKFVRSILRSENSRAREILVGSTDVSLSANGRIVAFEQGADIVVANIGTGRRLVINNASSPSLSGSGRRLAYEEATSPEQRSIFSAKLNTKRMRVIETTFIGIDPVDPVPDDDPSSNPVVSTDGRFVAFQSDASDLVPDDNNGVGDIFIYRISDGATTRLSVDGNGDEFEAGPFSVAFSNPSLSANGNLIAFDTNDGVLQVSDGVPQVLVREIFRGEPVGELRIVSIDRDGDPSNIFGSSRPSLAANGRFVSFESVSNNLTPDAVDNIGTSVFVARTSPDNAPVVDFPFDPPGRQLDTGASSAGRSEAGRDRSCLRCRLVPRRADSRAVVPLRAASR
jgi:Tol biopolymer transport system component